MLERFQLDPRKKGRTYSKGNRQKVAIVAALASDVELLVLDEPTSGLDPLIKTVFQDVVKEAKALGRTVLLSSHTLAEVEALADRVSIIRLGKIVQSGSLAELRHLTRTTIKAETIQPVTGLAELPGVYDVGGGPGAVQFAVDAEHINAVMLHLTGFGIRSLVSHPPTLEELFLRHYGDELAELGNGRVNGGAQAEMAR